MKNIITLLLLFFSTITIAQTNNSPILNGSLQVELAGLQAMSEEAINLKYPYAQMRPQEVYTDATGSVNFTASLRTEIPIEAEHLPELKELLKGNVSKNQGVSIIKDQMVTINGKQFVLIEFTSQAIDQKVYNMMYATNAKGNLLMGSFNFPNPNYHLWYNQAKETIYSIIVTE